MSAANKTNGQASIGKYGGKEPLELCAVRLTKGLSHCIGVANKTNGNKLLLRVITRKGAEGELRFW